MSAAESLDIEPISGPLDAVVVLPGSKSITNRALVCAGLAAGDSVLNGALRADDTEAMVDGLVALGVQVTADWANDRIAVTGCSGHPGGDVAMIDARMSGTTSRFLLPLAALGEGIRRVDGALRLRERPMEPALAALRTLGASVREVGAPGHLPVEVEGGSLRGGVVAMAGDVSSQFLSGLLLAGPAMPDGLEVRLLGDLVSRPYADMTVAVMSAFEAAVAHPDDDLWTISPQRYRGTDYTIEPDASAASYAFAAAAIVGGRVQVDGLGSASLQGDLAFVDLLRQMGATVERTATHTTVTGTGRLHGIEADLAQISDTAQTLAVVAAFADGPTRVTGIGFIRGKETDRVRAVVTELRRAGIQAEEEADGFVVRPGVVQPAQIETYDDHRMAMAFALLGARAPGITISDPGCVSKTFPGYWGMLDGLRHPGRVLPS
ncbi:MAG: 3-phosphoshikimate 1-carboxyvinyltransferase [Acidimicrobiales bacterium]